MYLTDRGCYGDNPGLIGSQSVPSIEGYTKLNRDIRILNTRGSLVTNSEFSRKPCKIKLCLSGDTIKDFKTYF
jgi:hypothetical protein